MTHKFRICDRQTASITACLLRVAGTLALFCMLLSFSTHSAAKGGNLTAEDALRQLPPSIFENTGEPVSEEEKERLLDRGYSRDWVVVTNHTDSLRLTTINDGRTAVSVQIFHRQNGGVVVLGARSADDCASEIWNYSAGGGLVPAPGPEEPTTEDFFTPGYALPKGVSPAYRICLAEDHPNLEVRPLFWGPDGPVDIHPVNRVLYGWNGSEFIKNVSPIAAP